MDRNNRSKDAMTSDLNDAKIDHAYACGMQQALAMVAQGAEEQARELAENLRLKALEVIIRKKVTP